MKVSTIRSDFEQWVAGARPRLVRMANSILKNQDDAEDVVQATLLSIWNLHEKGRIKNLYAYANRAVWINAIKLRGSRKRVITVGIDELSRREAAGLSVTAEPEPELTSWELERAIRGLPPEQQAVLRLRFYGDLSFREIGKSLRISLNTAASRTRYALLGLRRAFQIHQKK